MGKRGFLVIILVLVIIAGGWLTFHGLKPRAPMIEEKVLPFDFTVEEKLEFNVDKDKLHFGGVQPGGGSYREFRIFNNHSYAQQGEFKIASTVRMGDWFNISPGPTFHLNPYEDKNFEANLKIPSSTPFGSYSGEIRVTLNPIIEK